MSYLLDTQILIWWFMGLTRLNAEAMEAIGDPENLVHISAASAWEISIKSALGKIVVSDADLRLAIEDAAFTALPIGFDDALAAGALPAHHRDPFDRMLVAQAQARNLTLVTHDRALEPYGVAILWT